MLPQKNLSTLQISLLTALVIAIAAGFIGFLLKPIWWVALLCVVAFFIFCSTLIYYSLQQFIYRKIKLIYKFIYQTKASKKEEFYNKTFLPQKSIDEVRVDVEKWAQQHNAEIEVLQQNENYRREFLQNLSHELKTPIFAIQGYVETLLNGALNNPSVNQKFLVNTSRNIERLVNLVDDLDAISKLESGQLRLNKSIFIIQELSEEAFNTLSLKAEERNIRYTVKKGCELPLEAYADKEKIRQVLINLIDNSLKYGKQNGIIEASFYKLDGKRILIEISDDGSGIAEEHLNRIFERFYRTDLARSRKVGGSGLGLSICKHIIEAHNQTIHVRSKVDVGSTFGFTLESRKPT
jgi:two-component system, OmpR family, phosphate regulon sensor histidine kinase PhoR